MFFFAFLISYPSVKLSLLLVCLSHVSSKVEGLNSFSCEMLEIFIGVRSVTVMYINMAINHQPVSVFVIFQGSSSLMYILFPLVKMKLSVCSTFNVL